MLSGRNVAMQLTRVPTILLVEDAEVVRKSAARCLRRRGYVIIEASSAAQALELLAANGNKIDLLLTDLVLPAMGGAELVEEARRRQPAVGVAYMTGHLGISARCETELDETAPLLIKPFTPNLLEESVREALARAGWIMDGPSFGAH
jgi:two-component system, cell cycle sensor histidine kinase and response regulator CckA